MNILDAILLGLVEGITEYLPISSTGHLIIVSHLLGLDDQKHAVDAFNIMIQGGAILAVIGVFWSRVMQMIKGLLGQNKTGLKLTINLFVAFLPAAVIGLLLHDWIEENLFYAGPVTAALFLGGVALILLKRWQQKFFHDPTSENTQDIHTFIDIEHLTWKRALSIGLLQVFAMWPGTSRSMMTIIGGMMVGMKPKHAAEFSFLLGLPTLGGACVYEGYKNFFHDETNIMQDLGTTQVIVGATVAMLTAAVAVKWLIAYLSKHGLAAFGWYRIVLGSLLAVFILSGQITIEPDETDKNKTELNQVDLEESLSNANS